MSSYMNPTASSVGDCLDRMEDGLSRLVSLSGDVGGFRDGIHLREQIQNHVQSLMNLSKQAKNDISQLRRDGDASVDSLQIRFEDLSARMKIELPKVVACLKQNAPAPGGDEFSRRQDDFINQPLLEQAQLDSESDQIEMMTQEVNAILSTMREINQIFQQAFEEIQKQRHLVHSIDAITTKAVDNMVKGNKELEKAQEHQKMSRKALCWIFIIIAMVIVGVVIFCAVYFTKKK